MTAARLRLTLCTLFFLSGISGLMYQVVWFRMLARLMGVTIYATATVVSAFMGGLALGSFLLGRYIDRRGRPLRIYAFLEALIGLSAILVPPLLFLSVPLFQWMYEATGGSGAAVTATRAVVAFAVLLLPTTMMGGTLPVTTAFLTRREGLLGRSFGLLYGLNTAGAVAGVLLSGFVTIGLFGEWATIGIAVTINLAVAAVALTVSRRDEAVRPAGITAAAAEPATAHRVSRYGAGIRRLVLVAFFLSGFTALAYEIIWTRQLVMFLRTSIYAFAGMLAVFLSGIALGSVAMTRKADRLRAPLVWFGALELLVAAFSLLNLHLFVPLDSQIFRRLFGLSSVVLATGGIVFPLTFLFGMITPVAAVAYTQFLERTGASIGRLYSANTIGSILGSLAAGFLLIPWLGSSRTVLLLGLVNLGLGALLAWAEPARSPLRRAAVLVACGLLLLGGIGSIGADPFRTVVEQRIEARMGTTWIPDSNAALPKSEHIFLHAEGREATVTAFEVNRFKQLWINGTGMTFLTTATKLIAHLPILLVEEPREFLAIAFGMGTTIRSALAHPEIRVTTVDLVPETFETFGYYHPGADTLVRTGRLRFVTNDGRNELLFSEQRWDVITVDPAPPIYSAGTVNLYTKQFFELARSRLTPGGVMCLWFPGGTEVEVKALIRTFASVFPHATIWSGPHRWGYYLVGGLQPPDWGRFEARLAAFYADTARSSDLVAWDRPVERPEQLRALLMWQGPELDSLTLDAPIITDNYPFTEFPLWRYLLGERGLWHPRSTWLARDGASSEG